MLQIREPAEREIRQTKEGLARALAIMRATLEATTDGILVTDEKGKVAEFNDKYLAMWQIPRESLEGGSRSTFESSRAGTLRIRIGFSLVSGKLTAPHRRVSTSSS
jgi:PAS domain-containing protein